MKGRIVDSDNAVAHRRKCFYVV